jgi:hypothetical protein
MTHPVFNMSAESLSGLVGFGGPNNGTFDAGPVQNAPGVMQHENPLTAFQTGFAIVMPASETNRNNASVNPSENTTVCLAKFAQKWEQALTTHTLAFALRAPLIKNDVTIGLLSLPVINFVLGKGQPADPHHALTAKQRMSFAHGFLFPPMHPKADPTEAPRADPSQLSRLAMPYGVMQSSSNCVGASMTGGIPRGSVTVSGQTLTHHLWGTVVPGTRLFFATARVPRFDMHEVGYNLVPDMGSTSAPATSGVDTSQLVKTDAELHPFPYAMLPCWTRTDGKRRQLDMHFPELEEFEFFERHKTMMLAAFNASQQPKSPGHPHAFSAEVSVISVGVLLHAPRLRSNVLLQERAPFDAQSLAACTPSTILVGISMARSLASELIGPEDENMEMSGSSQISHTELTYDSPTGGKFWLLLNQGTMKSTLEVQNEEGVFVDYSTYVGNADWGPFTVDHTQRDGVTIFMRRNTKTNEVEYYLFNDSDQLVQRRTPRGEHV